MYILLIYNLVNTLTLFSLLCQNSFQYYFAQYSFSKYEKKKEKKKKTNEMIESCTITFQ